MAAVMGVSLLSQMVCSFDLFTHICILTYPSLPAMDLTHDFGDDLNKKMTAKGVLDVKINVSLKKVSTVTAWLEAKSVAEKILGCSLPSGCRVDHVAFLLEDCYKGPPTCGWAAYAYINSYASVFIRNYAAMPAVFTHELGHNLK